MQRHEGGYYVRLLVYDHPGAAAAIATRFAEQRISLETIMQKGAARKARRRGPRGRPKRSARRPDHLCDERERHPRPLDAVTADGHIAEPPQVIRIERE